MGRRPNHIIEFGTEFMAGQGLFGSRVDPATAYFSIWRVADNLVHGFHSHARYHFAQISNNNTHTSLKAILPDILMGKLGQPGLQLKAHDPNPKPSMAVIEKKADYATSSPQIQYHIPGCRSTKSRKQEAIHGKTIAIPVLPAMQPAVKQGIAGYVHRRPVC